MNHLYRFERAKAWVIMQDPMSFAFEDGNNGCVDGIWYRIPNHPLRFFTPYN